MLQEHTRCDLVRKNANKKCDQSISKKHSPKKTEQNKTNDGYECRDIKPERFHDLKLRLTDIDLINKRDKFDEMLTYLSSQQMVAFDAEWKPISASSVDIALIQFATEEKIYLVDVLSDDIGINDWNRLATKVFNNVEILKIGNFIKERLNVKSNRNSFKIILQLFHRWST